MNIDLSTEFQYLILFVAVIIVPKLFLRFRIPSGLTAMALGFLTAEFLGWFHGDQLVLMLSRLGITSLFLFAGMEIDLEELRKDGKALLNHCLKATVIILIAASALMWIFDLPYQPALVLALGLLTPSTGFIMSSLKNYKFTDGEEYWIRSKAIAEEIVAILVLFVALQSGSMSGFAMSSGVLISLIVLLPILVKLFLKYVAPYAPDTEVGFLILVALVCGVITKKIGTYYLVGAFIAGFVAGNFKHFVDHEREEQILKALGVFFTFFVPFYFYSAGLSFTSEMFTLKGLLIAVGFIVVFLTIRVLSVWLTIKWYIKEFWKDRYEISLSILPTLIFGLVISSILNERFGLSNDIISGLIIYTVVSSIIPALVFKKAPPVYHDPSMARMGK